MCYILPLSDKRLNCLINFDNDEDMASYREHISSDHLEKRRIPRFPVQLPAQLGHDPDMSSICTDLSSEGVSVETSKDFSVGERVSVQVTIAPMQPPLKMLGQVVWKQESDVKDPREKPVAELGIRFVRPMPNPWKMPADQSYYTEPEDSDYSYEVPFGE